jgi:hypothetical protein
MRTNSANVATAKRDKMAKRKDAYLSIVVASRNDDHGGGMNKRLRLFIDTLAQLGTAYGVPVELIIVEWNPPDDKEPLKVALNLTSIHVPEIVRFIRVPGVHHKRYPGSDRTPLFQYVAKNVGIRRASAKFVLATNADILFSEHLAQWLARKKLSSSRFYRAIRYDVPSDLDVSEPIVQRIARLRQCSKRAGNRPTGIARICEISRVAEMRDIIRCIGGRNWGAIHTDAAGDFFLMAKEHWLKLCGYPEIPSHAYVDGLICYLAAAHGLRQKLLSPDLCVYHLEHEMQWNRMGADQQHGYRHTMDYGLYRKYCRQIMDSCTIVFNNENWGLGGVELEEY